MNANSTCRLLIVGNPEEHHVGAHFLSAARQLGLEASLIDVRESHSRNIWVNRFFHRAWGKRPAHLERFSRRLAAICRERKPQMLLVTGISAPHAGALKEIGGMGNPSRQLPDRRSVEPRQRGKFFLAGAARV